jgi:hypothetical protein
MQVSTITREFLTTHAPEHLPGTLSTSSHRLQSITSAAPWSGNRECISVVVQDRATRYMGGMKARAPKNHADDRAASRFVELAARAEKMGEEEARKLWDSLPPDRREHWRGAFLKRIEQERDLGRVVMEKIFRIEGREFSTQPLEAALNSLNCATVEELFLAVGQGRVKGPDQIDVKICSKTSYLSLAFVL